MTPMIDSTYEANSGAAAPGSSIPVIANSTTRANAAEGSYGSVAANDFLTLLIAEMKNQDPTANTDPNQYVNQLVQVNSLQQLISINETLQSAFATPPRAEGKSSVSRAQAAISFESRGAPRFGTGGLRAADPGNLSIPKERAAASLIASALAGK